MKKYFLLLVLLINVAFAYEPNTLKLSLEKEKVYLYKHAINGDVFLQLNLINDNSEVVTVDGLYSLQYTMRFEVLDINEEGMATVKCRLQDISFDKSSLEHFPLKLNFAKIKERIEAQEVTFTIDSQGWVFYLLDAPKDCIISEDLIQANFCELDNYSPLKLGETKIYNSEDEEKGDEEDEEEDNYVVEQSVLLEKEKDGVLFYQTKRSVCDKEEFLELSGDFTSNMQLDQTTGLVLEEHADFTLTGLVELEILDTSMRFSTTAHATMKLL